MSIDLHDPATDWAQHLARMGVPDPCFDETGRFSFTLNGRYLVKCHLAPRHLVLSMRIGMLDAAAAAQQDDLLCRLLLQSARYARERWEFPALAGDHRSLLLQRWLSHDAPLAPADFQDIFNTFLDAFYAWQDWWQQASGDPVLKLGHIPDASIDNQGKTS